ncbi:MAG: hypothetical protein WCK29_03590 [archaeon]
MTGIEYLLNEAEKIEFVETPTNILAEAHTDYLASLPKHITLYDSPIGQQVTLWVRFGSQVIGREY